VLGAGVTMGGGSSQQVDLSHLQLLSSEIASLRTKLSSIEKEKLLVDERRVKAEKKVAEVEKRLKDTEQSLKTSEERSLASEKLRHEAESKLLAAHTKEAQLRQATDVVASERDDQKRKGIDDS